MPHYVMLFPKKKWLRRMLVANGISLEIQHIYMGSKQQRKGMYNIISDQFYRFFLISSESAVKDFLFVGEK